MGHPSLSAIGGCGSQAACFSSAHPTIIAQQQPKCSKSVSDQPALTALLFRDIWTEKEVGTGKKEDTTCVDRPESLDCLDGRRLPTGVMDDSPLANIRPEFWLENGGADASPGAHCPFHCFAKTLSCVALLLGKVPMRCDKPMLAKVWQTAGVRHLQHQDFSKTDLTAGVQQNLQLAKKAAGLTRRRWGIWTLRTSRVVAFCNAICYPIGK